MSTRNLKIILEALICYFQVAAMLASGMILMMPTMVLSGMIFPVESMPLILQLISDIIPARWYIQAVRKMMIEGVSVVPVSYTHLDVYKRQVHYCLWAGLPDEGVQVTGGEA